MLDRWPLSSLSNEERLAMELRRSLVGLERERPAKDVEGNHGRW
jgi:hypothetical protein